MKPKHIALLILVASYAALCFLTGCASTSAHSVAVAPAPAVSTTALGQSIATGYSTATSARQRTETVIQTVDRIITKTDPETATELRAVKVELSTVSADLQTSKDALVRAEAERVQAQQSADALRTWGVAQQAASLANANGWQKAEIQSGERQRHVLKLQSIIGLALGIGAGILGLKLFGPYGTLAGPIVFLLSFLF